MKKKIVALTLLIIMLFTSVASAAVTQSGDNIIVPKDVFLQMAKDIEMLDSLEELTIEQKILIDMLKEQIQLLQKENGLYMERVDIKDKQLSLWDQKQESWNNIEVEMRDIIKEQDNDIAKYRFNISKKKWTSSFAVIALTAIGASLAEENSAMWTIIGVGGLSFFLVNQ